MEDFDYPKYELQESLLVHYGALQKLYRDVFVNFENSVDLKYVDERETYACNSTSSYIRPLRALNVFGKWRIIVNNMRIGHEKLTQSARIEECVVSGDPCDIIVLEAHYNTQCVQKTIYHRFLVYDPYDYTLPFMIDSFKLPSACACHVEEYNLLEEGRDANGKKRRPRNPGPVTTSFLPDIF